MLARECVEGPAAAGGLAHRGDSRRGKSERSAREVGGGVVVDREVGASIVLLRALAGEIASRDEHFVGNGICL